jgi:DNA-directed RNA polymerase sigma subunit (sigma70/sigma32)
MNKNFTNLTDLDIQNLIDLYQNGTSLTKIKLQFKISDKRVKQILTEHNIHIRSHRESKLVYQYNEDYFNQIDTPDKAY